MVSQVMGSMLDQICNGGEPVVKVTAWHIALDGSMSPDVEVRLLQCQEYIDKRDCCEDVQTDLAFSLQYAFDFIEHISSSGVFTLETSLTPFGFQWFTKLHFGVIMLVPSTGGWVTTILPKRS